MVEDDKALRDGLAMNLGLQGYDVLTAADGEQGMQLASKMRYIAAQFDAFLENDLWKRNALHANRMAQELFIAVKDIPGVEVTQKVESNAVFARIPAAIIPRLQEQFFFYVWDEERSEVRWMCSFDTTTEDIVRFASLLRSML